MFSFIGSSLTLLFFVPLNLGSNFRIPQACHCDSGWYGQNCPDLNDLSLWLWTLKHRSEKVGDQMIQWFAITTTATAEEAATTTTTTTHMLGQSILRPREKSATFLRSNQAKVIRIVLVSTLAPSLAGSLVCNASEIFANSTTSCDIWIAVAKVGCCLVGFVHDLHLEALTGNDGAKGDGTCGDLNWWIDITAKTAGRSRWFAWLQRCHTW